ncbi:hypothetical protein COU61_01705, partial [Candidatus Pacearchaeota archaeon CG10_big_fil_rev_8_21_14_0_10_35_13]
MEEKEKITLKKINDYEWEIPKTGGMKVPGRIFASEKLIEAIKEDQSLEQVRNVAMLKGIIGKSIAMSDAHRGYGFSIGGVAAFDIDKGIISPGGVGYDINCLEGNTKILNELGYWKMIKDYNEKSIDSLGILNKKNKEFDDAKIKLLMKRKADKILKIRTKSGSEVLATKEHPIFTKKGMVESESINKGEDVLLYPFEGVEYEAPKKELLISDEDIDGLNRTPTSKLQIKNNLRKLGLLPLYSDNTKISMIIRIMGFVFGDGNLSTGKSDQVGFYGKEEDLNTIREDLKKIGFSSSLYSRKRNHQMKTQYSSYEFERTEKSLRSPSSSLAVLLNLLGTPAGNKALQDYQIPEWIMRSPKWYKRLFIASLFGAELSTPRTMTNHKFNMYGLIFSLNKREPLHGISFVNQISSILDEFEIKNVLIKNRTDELNGTKSTRIRLMIYNTLDNLIRYFTRINYDYNKKKRKLANAATVWLRLKERILHLREKTMNKARKMKGEGFTKGYIIQTLSGRYTNKYFIDKSLYQSNYGITGSRIAFRFMSFNEFLNERCYGEQGFIWDKIEDIKELEHNNLVYDFNMDDYNHNFIANGLVVS